MSDPQPIDGPMSRFRSQIGEIDADEPTRQHLGGLADDIEARLVRSGDVEAGADDQLNERLNASILKFEASHPRIAELLNDLTEQLGKMGI